MKSLHTFDLGGGWDHRKYFNKFFEKCDTCYLKKTMHTHVFTEKVLKAFKISFYVCVLRKTRFSIIDWQDPKLTSTSLKLLNISTRSGDINLFVFLDETSVWGRKKFRRYNFSKINKIYFFSGYTRFWSNRPTVIIKAVLETLCHQLTTLKISGGWDHRKYFNKFFEKCDTGIYRIVNMTYIILLL